MSEQEGPHTYWNIIRNPEANHTTLTVRGYQEGACNGFHHGRMTGMSIEVGDGGAVRNHAIVNVTATSPIGVETADDIAWGPDMWETGTHVFVYGVSGIPEANTWARITRTGPRSFTLDGTSGTGTYQGGGFTSNRGMWVGLGVAFMPTDHRHGLEGHPAQYGDDCGGIGVYNASPNGSMGTGGYYGGHNPIFGDRPEVWELMTFDMNAVQCLSFLGKYVLGIDFSKGVFSSGVVLKLGPGQRMERADAPVYSAPPAQVRTLKGGRPDDGNTRDVLATLVADLKAAGLIK